MMTPADYVLVGTALIGAATSILARHDVKRSMAEGWGSLTKEVSENSRRISVVETTVQDHTEAIGYLKGKTNGHAAGHRQ